MSAAKASVAMPEDTIKATHAPIVWRTTDRLEASAFEDEATLTRSLPRTREASSSHPPSPFVAFHHHHPLLLLLLLVVVAVVKYEDDDDDDDVIRDHLFSLSTNARPTQSGVGAFDALEDDDVNDDDDKELPPRFVETTTTTTLGGSDEREDAIMRVIMI